LHSFWTGRVALSKSGLARGYQAEFRVNTGWRVSSFPDWMNMSGVNEIRSTFLNFFA